MTRKCLYVCDKCGAQFSEEMYKEYSMALIIAKNNVDLVKLQAQQDLCQKCTKEFNTWWKT